MNFEHKLMNSFKGNDNEDTFWRAGKEIEDLKSDLDETKSEAFNAKLALSSVVYDLIGVKIDWNYVTPDEASNTIKREIKKLRDENDKKEKN